jgi:hypothetical protein
MWIVSLFYGMNRTKEDVLIRLFTDTKHSKNLTNLLLSCLIFTLLAYMGKEI